MAAYRGEEKMCIDNKGGIIREPAAGSAGGKPPETSEERQYSAN